MSVWRATGLGYADHLNVIPSEPAGETGRLQAVSHTRLVHYNTERPHLGYRNQVRTPLDTINQFVNQEGQEDSSNTSWSNVTRGLEEALAESVVRDF